MGFAERPKIPSTAVDRFVQVLFTVRTPQNQLKNSLHGSVGMIQVHTVLPQIAEKQMNRTDLNNPHTSV